MKTQPPRLARKLFKWLAGPAFVDDLLGDMDEWFYKNLETHSPFRARVKYWKQVLSLLFSYAIRKRKRQAQLSPFSQRAFSFAIVKNYFIVASRSLNRHRYFTIVNAAGLAIGMSISLLVITMFAYVCTYDNFHVNKNRIFRVISSHEKGVQKYDMASAPIQLADKLKSNLPGIEQVTRITSNFRGEALINNSNVPVQGFYVDPEFLSIFSFELLEGNAATALQKPKSIILTQSSSKKLFGDEPAFGRIIEIVKKGNFEITGILKDPPRNTHFSFESLVSYSTLPVLQTGDVIQYENPFQYGLEFVYMLVRDKKQTGIIESYLSKLAEESGKISEAKINYTLQALTDINPGRDLSMLTGGLGAGWSYSVFIIFGIIALLILLPACFNYTNISIARALKRAKEIGLRKTMGGTRRQIFFQFIAETTVVTLISLTGALLVFFLIRKEFLSMIAFSETLDLSLTAITTGLFILFAIVTGFIAGFVPAVFFSGLNPVQALKNQSPAKAFSGMWLRKSLTVFQFILSFGFIVALIVFARQYRYSMNYDFGFRQENIFDVNLQGVDPDLFASEYSQFSFVHNISFSSDVLGLHSSFGGTWMQMEGTPDSLQVSEMFCDRQYIETLGLKFLAGSNFPDIPWNHEQSIIVNERFLELFGIPGPADAIGKVVRVDRQDLQITGVLKDFHYSSLRESIKSFAFRTNPSQYRHANLNVSFTDAYAGITQMEKLWKKMGNTTAFKGDFLNEEINMAYKSYTSLVKITGFLGFLAISISLLGMLGMVVYTSETRTKEVGIRKVMGASAAGIAYLLSKDYLKLMAWAFVIAIPLSVIIIDKLLSMTQYYSVTLTVWDILAGMVILVGLGVLTISTQTIKTANINPAETLRSE
ncbi:MAG: ABC transporter permease [Cyclobacteriaceae bacterium]|nr:ABC transporter permease [Cyclobacteriaceae bacterium]